MPRTLYPVEDDGETWLALLEYIEKKRGGHWVWVGSFSPHGTPSCSYQGRSASARRVILALHSEKPVPGELEVVPVCGNKKCVNPRHLQAMTHAEETRYSRGPAAENARKTKCAQGHPLSGKNLIVDKDGRHCRICRAEKSTKYLNRMRRLADWALAHGAPRNG